MRNRFCAKPNFALHQTHSLVFGSRITLVRRLSTYGSREKEGANHTARASLFTYVTYLSQPEQEAQQSAEAQHVAFAAFTAPVKPSAITAINRNARMFFIFFSFEKSNWFFVDRWQRHRREPRQHSWMISRCEAGALGGECLCRCARRKERVRRENKTK